MLLPVVTASPTARFARVSDARTVVVLRRSVPHVVSLLALASLAFLLTWHQSTWNIQDWDEGRHIASAVEMLRSGDWLVNTYMGSPDLWNLKPPVSFWAIAASMQVFGATPFAMHLPSILATLATAVTCWWFARRHAGDWAGAFAIMAVASCTPLINAHTGRTADPDAIYLCALTASIVSAISALANPRWLLVATLSFSVAFLTKSWHSALVLGFLAAISGILLVRSRRNVRAVALSALGFVPLFAWVVARFAADGTRFLVPMVQYDLLSRSGTTLEGHYQTKTFYIDQFQGAFGLWLAAGVFGIGLHLATRLRGGEADRASLPVDLVLVLLLGWCASVLAAFSLASTKLFWYVAPVYPAAAMLSAIGIGLGIRAAARRNGVRALIVATGLLAFVIGAQDLRVALSTTYDNPTQTALSRLGALSGRDDAAVYLDPALGGWSQSLVAVAESSGLKPEPVAPPAHGGRDAYLLVGGDPATSSSSEVIGSRRPVGQFNGISIYRLS